MGSKVWVRSDGTHFNYRSRFYCPQCFQQVRSERGLISRDHPCPGRGTIADFVGVLK